MKIQLKYWKIANLNFSLLDDVSKREKNSFDLETGSHFSDKESSDFRVNFRLKIKDKAFDILLDAFFQFELVDEKITEEFKLSSFPKVNAPAIAFPYLRAFISNLTLQAGFEPIILPSINFINLGDKEEFKED
ncbi:preprotein translocase subunit SecB [Arachidicoccus ginsenosidimutans]|uniref:protein-export chaperone SecB n=1 Tax=Arachidicoccus sp. BS20 TaxID=1850526 RepID=UPI0007F0C1F2|nr:protein-export chaperone SecB [Arachidicoccus sp. BS20]ANI88819.1 preprotein translocase subunit SecB [Arachidicoccus sp. BS20]